MNRSVQFVFALITLWVAACSESARTNETADLQTLTVETRPFLQPTPTRTRSPYILNVFTPEAQEVEGLQVELLPNEDYTDALLHITRNGIQEYEFSVFGIIGEFSSIGNVRLLSIQDLDLDGEVEIVLDTFLHGAYCCTVIAVVYFDESAQQYSSSNLIYRKWGFSPRLVNVNGDNKPEFFTRDESFTFLAGGATATAAITPLQLYQFVNGEIVETTLNYPLLIEQDAMFWLAVSQGATPQSSDEYITLTRQDPEFWASQEGIEWYALAVYVANMFKLGRSNEALSIARELCNLHDCHDRLERLVKLLGEPGA